MSEEFTRQEVNRALLVTAFALASADAVRMPPAPTPLFDFAIAGGNHHALYKLRQPLPLNEKLVLRAEPDNPHDANAVAVLRGDGLMLGYIPRVANEPIARLLEQGRRIDAMVVECIRMRSYAEPPDDLVYTAFLNGDPRIRLILRS